MTEAQIIARIVRQAEEQANNIAKVRDLFSDIDNFDTIPLAQAVLAAGAGIMDSLNTIALALAGLLPKNQEGRGAQ